MAGRKDKQESTEFRILVAPAVNERTGRPATIVTLQTTKSFSTFRYVLAVEDRLEPGVLRLKVLGLRTPSLDLPATGPAEFRKEYEGLSGDLRIVNDRHTHHHGPRHADVSGERQGTPGRHPVGNPHTDRHIS